MDSLLHSHQRTAARRRLHFHMIHEGLHHRKAHTAAFLLRLGGIEGFHSLLHILDTPTKVLHFQEYHIVFQPCTQRHHTPRTLIAMDNGVGHSFRDRCFDVCNLAYRRTQLHSKSGSYHAGKGLIFRQGEKSSLHFIGSMSHTRTSWSMAWMILSIPDI